MKKSSLIIIIIIVIIALGIASYALFHKSQTPTSTTKTSAKSSSSAVNNAVLVTKTDSNIGEFLASPSGKPLYTYSGDSSGVSNCTGPCLVSWPVYQDLGSTANLPKGVGTIKRTDNSQIQFTYNGMPLYNFTGDSGGKVSGDGIDSFHVAKPSASSSSKTSSTPPTSSQPSSGAGMPSTSSNYSY